MNGRVPRRQTVPLTRLNPAAPGGRNEAGAATALAVGLLAACVAGGAMVLCWAMAATEETAMQSAADLSALSASASARGLGSSADPCGVAGETAARNHARVTSCQVLSGSGARVRVEVLAVREGQATAWLPVPAATASSWAGPPP